MEMKTVYTDSEEGKQEMMMRILAEAIHRLGGSIQVPLADLSGHRGRIAFSLENDVLTATFSGKKATA